MSSLVALETPRPERLRLQRMGFVLALVLPAGGAVAAPLYSARQGLTWVEPVTFLVFLTLSAVGVEVGYHRHFSHAAFQAKPWLRRALAILGSMALQGPLSYWVAHHRLHHARTDVPGDPHSPHLDASAWRGFWHAHVGWIFQATRASPGRFARDVLADRALAGVNRSFLLWALVGLLLPALIGGIGTWSSRGFIAGFLWGGLLRVFVAQHTTYLVNSLCHCVGSRPFPCGGQSRNVGWLVLPTFGGSLHNNHHAFPSTADNRLSPGELDPSGALIRVFAGLGWAWDVKRPTPEQIERRRAAAPQTLEPVDET